MPSRHAGIILRFGLRDVAQCNRRCTMPRLAGAYQGAVTSSWYVPVAFSE